MKLFNNKDQHRHYIVNRYRYFDDDYYENITIFDKDHKLWKKSVNKQDLNNKVQNDFEEKSTRHELHLTLNHATSAVVSWKRFLFFAWVVLCAVGIVGIIVCASLCPTDAGIWLPSILTIVFGVINIIWLIQRFVYLKKYHEDYLEHNTKKLIKTFNEQNELREDRINQLREAHLFNYNTLKDACALYQKIVATGEILDPKHKNDSTIYVDYFEPRLIEQNGVYRFDPNCLLRYSGGIVLCIIPMTTKYFENSKDSVKRFNEEKQYIRAGELMDETVWRHYMSDTNIMLANHSIIKPELTKSTDENGNTDSDHLIDQINTENAKKNKKTNEQVEVLVILNAQHVFVEGPTGSAKTQLIVMWSLISMLGSKERPSVFLNSKDYAETFLYYRFAILAGYKVVLLNLSNPSTSDKYNPFSVVWENQYNLYCLNNAKLQHIVGFTPAEFNDSFNFRIKFTADRNNRDNYYYIRPNAGFIRFELGTNNKPMHTPKELLDNIIAVTGDSDLANVFSEYKSVNELSVQQFSRILLENYHNYTTNTSYVLGPICNNCVMPAKNSATFKYFREEGVSEQNQKWATALDWIKCGSIAFIDEQDFKKNWSSLIATLTSDYSSLLELAVGAVSPAAADSGTDFWNNSAKDLFKGLLNVFFIGLRKDGPELFCEEYCTPENIYNSVSYCFTDPSYGIDVSKINVDEPLNKKLLLRNDQPGGGNNPYVNLVDVLNDPNCFLSFPTAMAATKDTYNGVWGNYSTLFGVCATAQYATMTQYTSTSPSIFLMAPTLVITVMASTGDSGGKDSSNSPDQLINAYFHEIIETVMAVSLTAKKAPRKLNFLLDEAGALKFDLASLVWILIQGRSANVFLTLIVQFREQLQSLYGSDKLLNAMESNCATKIALRVTPQSVNYWSGQFHQMTIPASFKNLSDDRYNPDNKESATEEDVLPKKLLLGLPLQVPVGTITANNESMEFMLQGLKYHASVLKLQIENLGQNIFPPTAQNVIAPHDELRFDYLAYLMKYGNVTKVDPLRDAFDEAFTYELWLAQGQERSVQQFSQLRAPRIFKRSKNKVMNELNFSTFTDNTKGQSIKNVIDELYLNLGENKDITQTLDEQINHKNDLFNID